MRRLILNVLIFWTASLLGQSFSGYDFYIIDVIKKDTIFIGVVYCEKREVKQLVEQVYTNQLSFKTITRYRRNRKIKNSDKKIIFIN
jgi:hypothetical protein